MKQLVLANTNEVVQWGKKKKNSKVTIKLIWGHSFITYARAYQGVRNVSFSENFACVLNE